MSAETLVSRLEGVRGKGPGRWVARCPAHKDRNPSLTVTELHDGRVLCHCHAGCETEAVLSAVGLKFEDLYPDSPIEHGKRTARPISHAQALAVISFEANYVATVAADLAAGRPMDDAARTRALKAAERINKAYSLSAG